jgi:hypothetical protein
MSLREPPLADMKRLKWSTTLMEWTRQLWKEVVGASNYSGSWTNNEGDTVTVVNGKITDVS